ncbi:MAG: pantetheine-phosphate adenylyltransferase [Pseudomonadota bacterium]|jgi:pantetheine-phosphate adenylyltransferase|nr:pantetheine-phosphate adenylyltransferase [Alphaproteobacteria bacterium]
MQRIGVYPGTFDPIHNGHIDIIQRATRLVDKLVIAVAINEDKGPLFSLQERVEMMRAETERMTGPDVASIEIVPFKNLVTQFAEEMGAQVIIRGLRGVADFDYEFQMAGMNARLNPRVETIFLMSEASNQAIASKLIREIARLGGDVADFTTPAVSAKLSKAFAR